MSLGDQVEDAKKQMASWTPEKCALMQLQGHDKFAPASPPAKTKSMGNRIATLERELAEAKAAGAKVVDDWLQMTARNLALSEQLSEAKEREAKYAALHKAADAVVNYAGAYGSITARGDLMQSLLDALYAIDGGNYDPKEQK